MDRLKQFVSWGGFCGDDRKYGTIVGNATRLDGVEQYVVQPDETDEEGWPVSERVITKEDARLENRL